MEVKKEKVLEKELVNLKDLAFKKIQLKYSDASNSDYGFLSEDLKERLGEELKALKKKGLTFFAGVKPYYSLSNSQGDGFMFEGSFVYKGLHVIVKQSGHYYHERSKEIRQLGYRKQDICFWSEKTLKKIDALEEEFDQLIYIPLCIKMEKLGYASIEAQEKDDICRAGFRRFCELNKLPDLDLIDYDFELKEKAGFVCISEDSDSSFELWVDPEQLDFVRIKSRVLETKTFVKEEYLDLVNGLVVA